MGKRVTAFRHVKFDWMIPVEERQRIETLLSEMGYTVDGGGTDLGNHTAEIFIRPKARVRNRAQASASALGGAQ